MNSAPRAAHGSVFTASRTTLGHRFTFTQRHASWTTCGPRSARTTSTSVPGPTTRNCPARSSTTGSTSANHGYWIGSVTGHAYSPCLLYTSDAADEEDSVDLGGRR